MDYPDLRGKLIALDLYNCDANILEDHERVIGIIKTCCDNNGMQLLKVEHSDAEAGNAYSLFAVCIQGHIAVHAFPEYGFCALDTYSIGEESHPSHCAKDIRKELNPDKVKITILNRGDFSNENDMKPHRRSSSKLIRRTKNFGGKLKKMMLKPRGI